MRLIAYALIGLCLAMAGVTAAGATYVFAPKVTSSFEAAVEEPAGPVLSAEALEEISRDCRASQKRNLRALRAELKRIKAEK